MTDPRRLRLLMGVLGVLLVFLALRLVGIADGSEPAADTPLVAPGAAADLAAGGYAARGAPVAARAPETSRRARRADEPAEPVNEVVDLDLDLLDRQARSYTPGRDPWRFGEPPPPPPAPTPPPPSPAEVARMRAEEELLAQQRAAEAERLRQEALKPKPSPFTMKFLGSFGPASRRLAVFSDGQTIFNAREGEVLQGKFIVARIGYESVDIQFVGFPDWPAQRLAVGG